MKKIITLKIHNVFSFIKPEYCKYFDVTIEFTNNYYIERVNNERKIINKDDFRIVNAENARLHSDNLIYSEMIDIIKSRICKSYQHEMQKLMTYDYPSNEDEIMFSKETDNKLLLLSK